MGDLCTLAGVKQYLGLTVNTGDALLSSLITRTSAAIESYLCRSILAADHVEYRDGNGGSMLLCADYPVTAVHSVQINGAEVPAASAVWNSPGYRFSAKGISVCGQLFYLGRQNVRLQYTAGFDTVPGDIEQACIETVALSYKRKDHLDVSSKSLAGESISFTNVQLGAAAKTMLAPYRRVAIL